jgi:ATP-dependent Lon protease
MTGEVTLTGRVLPVGGIREKILAARRAGINTVIVPRHNEKDLVELPAEVKDNMTVHLVDTLDDVVPLLFRTEARSGKPKSAKPRVKTMPKPRAIAPAEPDQTVPPVKPARRPRLA